MAKKSKGCFVMLERELLTCENYKQLSSSAKVIYTYARLEAGRQNGGNLFSGDFKLPYTLIQKYTGFSTPTICSALEELYGYGFLIKTIPGGLRGVNGVPNSYRLSLKWQDSSPYIKQKRAIRQKKQNKAALFEPWGGNIGKSKQLAPEPVVV